MKRWHQFMSWLTGDPVCCKCGKRCSNGKIHDRTTNQFYCFRKKCTEARR